jgi:GNAT superfamily N-acetyltransferase
MYRKIEDVAARDGASWEMGVITAPAPDFLAEMSAFYMHKGELWLWTVEASLGGEWDGVTARFYVASVAGRVVASVMVNENWGVGEVAHVYTVPEQRGRGLCSRLMREAVEDFDRRGGRVLYLGTGYDSTAYHIYSRCGFRSVTPESGLMLRTKSLDVEADLFAPAETRVVHAAWRHYPLMNALSMTPSGGMRSRLLQPTRAAYGPSMFEWAFLVLLDQALARRVEFRVLEVAGRCVAGWGTLAPRWGVGGDGWLLDFHVHPRFAADADRLIEALPARPGLTCAYVTSQFPEKANLLRRHGFRPDTPLPVARPDAADVAWGRLVRGTREARKAGLPDGVA